MNQLRRERCRIGRSVTEHNLSCEHVAGVPPKLDRSATPRPLAALTDECNLIVGNAIMRVYCIVPLDIDTIAQTPEATVVRTCRNLHLMPNDASSYR